MSYLVVLEAYNFKSHVYVYFRVFIVILTLNINNVFKKKIMYLADDILYKTI